MILSCANAYTVDEFIAYTNLLKKNRGDFIMVGIPALTKVELQLPFFALVVRQISFVGSLVGSRQENYEMIEFTNKHKIYPPCVQFEFDKLLNGRPKYRCVFKVGNAPETLKNESIIQRNKLKLYFSQIIYICIFLYILHDR